MGPLGTIGVAWDSLRRHPLRASLATAGVVVGIGAVVAMIGLGRGAQAQIDAYMQVMGANVLVLMPGSPRFGGVHLGTGARQTLTEGDAHALATQLDSVETVAPIIRDTRQLVAAARNWPTAVYATTNAYFEAREWALAAGRGFSDDDFAQAAKVLIVGQRVVRELFGDDVPPEEVVGTTVRMRSVPFTIVGVLAAKGQHMGGEDADDAAFVPLSTGRVRVFGAVRGRANLIHSVLLKVRADASMADAKDEILRLVRQRHGLPAAERDDRFMLRDLTEHIVARREASRTMSAMLATIAGVSLLVGGIGIMNIMLVSVTERTREIGLRMAVGARGADILGQFLVEASLLAVLGGVAGVALGLAAGEGIGRHLGWRVLVESDAMGVAFAVAATVGVAAGLYPAIRASRLQPIVALRHE